MLVWDKQPNKALAAITDILDSVSANSMNRRENAGRFVVVRRWDFVLHGKGDGSTTSDYVKNFDEWVKLPKGCVSQCTSAGANGVIGEIISGALHLVSVGITAAGTAAAEAKMNVRVNFRDV